MIQDMKHLCASQADFSQKLVRLVSMLMILCLQIYTSFYCRQNEPSYIKMIKLEILSAIADETNAYDITTELTEYVTDIDEPLGRAAVKAVGRIALEV